MTRLTATMSAASTIAPTATIIRGGMGDVVFGIAGIIIDLLP